MLQLTVQRFWSTVVGRVWERTGPALGQGAENIRSSRFLPFHFAFPVAPDFGDGAAFI